MNHLFFSIYFYLSVGLPRWLTGKESTSTQETRVQYLNQECSLEEEMATHSSILAWKIPWTEEPCRLQSMGSQRVRHDLATEHLSVSGSVCICLSQFIHSSTHGCIHLPIYPSIYLSIRPSIHPLSLPDEHMRMAEIIFRRTDE